MAVLSGFIVMRNDRYAHDCKDGAAVTRWQHLWMHHNTTAWHSEVLWAKNMAARDIQIDMLPMYNEHCLSCQATL
jgi:hypothetical protein